MICCPLLIVHETSLIEVTSKINSLIDQSDQFGCSKFENLEIVKPELVEKSTWRNV